jgi:hypothetical protein
MATWHQLQNKAGMTALYQPPINGHKVVVNHPNALAHSMHFNRKRDAERFAKKTRGTIISAVKKDAQKLEPETPVIFRIERRKGGEVTAVFPCEPHNMSGNEMSCYVHVGQHGACSFAWFNSSSHRLAKPEEYQDLKRELESAPYTYRLKVYKRLQPWMREEFKKEIRRLNSRS